MHRRRRKKDSPITTVILIVIAVAVMISAILVVTRVIGKIQTDYVLSERGNVCVGSVERCGRVPVLF